MVLVWKMIKTITSINNAQEVVSHIWLALDSVINHWYGLEIMHLRWREQA